MADARAPTGDQLDPERWLEAHGDTLYRYALGRTGSPDVAEDLVQEALLAAWRNRDGFQGAAKERTWLIGILHHKVVDHLRRRARYAEVNPGDGVEETFFDGDGAWRVRPAIWGGDPLALNEAEAFMIAVGGCLDKLPPNQRASFTLREIEDVAVEEASEALDIKANNLYVLLHRARLAMRRCLEVHWFGGDRKP